MHPIRVSHSLAAAIQILVFIIILEDNGTEEYQTWISYADHDSGDIIVENSVILSLQGLILIYLGIATVGDLGIVWFGPAMEKWHGIIWLRWVMYAMSTPFLVIIMLLISDVRNLDLLIVLGFGLAFVNIIGAASEYAGYCACISQNVYDTRRWWIMALLTSSIAWVVFIDLVIEIAIAMGHASDIDTAVIAANVIEYVIFIVFGIAHSVYLWRVKQFLAKTFTTASAAHTDYILNVAQPIDHIFCAMSTVSKCTLALIVMASSDL